MFAFDRGARYVSVFWLWMFGAPHAPFQVHLQEAIFHKERIAGPKAGSCHPFQLPEACHVRRESEIAAVVTFASRSCTAARLDSYLRRRSESSNSAVSSCRATLNLVLAVTCIKIKAARATCLSLVERGPSAAADA